jgi:hypothetical protein
VVSHVRLRTMAGLCHIAALDEDTCPRRLITEVSIQAFEGCARGSSEKSEIRAVASFGRRAASTGEE